MNLTPITRLGGRGLIKLKKHSPQILFYGGIIGTVATTVLASRATLRAVPIIEDLQGARAELDEFSQKTSMDSDTYSKEVIRQYTVTTVNLTKLYAPVVVVGVGSLFALTKSHQQLMNRNAALTVAYTGLLKTFESYRGRVREQLGIEQDHKFLHGETQKEVEYEDKSGKTKTKAITTLDDTSDSALTVVWDSRCKRWEKDPGYNQNFLNNQEKHANLELKRRGYFFLNDVYDLLELPRTRDGQILGWVYKDLGDNDMHIEFRHNEIGEFHAGYSRDTILNFNIHGPILDLI